MQSDNNIKGKVVDVSGIEKETCCDLSVKTSQGIAKLHLSSAKMGLGSVDEYGHTKSIVQQFDKSAGTWFPISIVNPKKIVGRKVSIDGAMNESKDLQINNLRSFKLL